MLKQRLKTKDALQHQWRLPVEDQNDEKSPKYIVDDLFTKYLERKYTETTDAPWILERASLDEVVKACPQCFAPFVGDLEAIASGAV